MEINGAKHVSRLSKTRPSIDAQAPINRELNADFWLQFSENPSPNNRQKMVYVTMDDVSRVGPATFNAIAVCDALEVSYSLVNFHFGSRDELLAEATALVYQRFITDLWKLVEAAKRSPEDRLRAWIEGTVALYTVMGGWGSIINYPTASLQITELVHSRYGNHMADLAEVNMARLYSLVSDVKNKKISDVQYEIGSIPREAILKDGKVASLAGSIGYSTLGMAVWSAGRSLPPELLTEQPLLDAMIMKEHVKRIIAQI